MGGLLQVLTILGTVLQLVLRAEQIWNTPGSGPEKKQAVLSGATDAIDVAVSLGAPLGVDEKAALVTALDRGVDVLVAGFNAFGWPRLTEWTGIR